MKNMVYALRGNGQIDLLTVIPGSAYGSYLFQDSDGKKGTWKKLTGRPTTGKFYRNQYDSAQGTVRCTGCHVNLNLSSEWAAGMLGTWTPEAVAYGFEFKGKFNQIPAGAQARREFNFVCYGGEPCFAHMRTHFYPKKEGMALTDIPIDPQPSPWAFLPSRYHQYIVDRYGEPPRVLGGESDLSVEDWLANVRKRNLEH